MAPPKKTPTNVPATKAPDEDYEDEMEETPASSQATPSAKKSRTPKREWVYNHIPNASYSGNGRHEGRVLIPWTRPRMAEKLLVNIMYECSRYKSEIPWDSIAHRFHPGSSGGAILQHLNRLRSTLIAEGHLVPPLCQKPGSKSIVDPTIRGYIRASPEGAENVHLTRPVPFSEPIEDRRFNLPDAIDRGSRARNMNEAALLPGTTPPSRKRSRAVPAVIKRESLSPNVDDMPSDEEYVPGRKSKPARRSTRAKKVKYTEDVPDHDFEEDEEDEESPSKGKQRQSINGGKKHANAAAVADGEELVINGKDNVDNQEDGEDEAASALKPENGENEEEEDALEKDEAASEEHTDLKHEQDMFANGMHTMGMQLPLPLANGDGQMSLAHFGATYPTMMMGVPGMNFMGANQMALSHDPYQYMPTNNGHLALSGGYDPAGNFTPLQTANHNMSPPQGIGQQFLALYAHQQALHQQALASGAVVSHSGDSGSHIDSQASGVSGVEHSPSSPANNGQADDLDDE